MTNDISERAEDTLTPLQRAAKAVYGVEDEDQAVRDDAALARSNPDA